MHRLLMEIYKWLDAVLNNPKIIEEFAIVPKFVECYYIFSI